LAGVVAKKYVALASGLKHEKNLQEEAFFGGVGGSEATCILESIDDEMVGVLELVKSLCRSETAAMGNTVCV